MDNPRIDGFMPIKKPSVGEAMADLEHIEKTRDVVPEYGILNTRINPDKSKIDAALAFWRPRYFDATINGRTLNGAEAYAIGAKGGANQVVYIAMCNLMALEALRMMGDQNPTVEDARDLRIGSDREKSIADYWKKTFAPTAFQTEWAWKAVLAILAGSEVAINEVLNNFMLQLP